MYWNIFAIHNLMMVYKSKASYSPQSFGNLKVQCQTSLQLGDAECRVTDSTDSHVTCVTPAHMEREVEVKVLEAGTGRASGMVTFTFDVQLSSISHCSG